MKRQRSESEICLHLHPSDLGRLACVSKRFRKLLHDDPDQQFNIWKAMFNKWGAHALSLCGITETSWKPMFVKLHKIKKLSVDGTFNVVICGDHEVGKRSFAKKIAYNPSSVCEFPTHSPTSCIDLETNVGVYRLNLSLCSGENHLSERDSILLTANAAIIMFDVTNRVSYKNVPIYHRDIRRVCEDIPIVLCSTKVDVEMVARKVKTKQIMFHRKKNLQFVETSTKANYHLFDPFKYILRKLIGENSLVLKYEPPIAPPEATVSDEMIASMQITWSPLPDEDEC